MPTLISLRNGKTSTLFTPRDFEYLIDEFMGYDSKEYFRKLVADYEDQLNDLNEEITDQAHSIRTLQNKLAEKESQFNEQ